MSYPNINIVDWKKTKMNIISKLGIGTRTNAKCFSELLGVCERQARYKLSPTNNSQLTIDELLIIERYTRCDLKDLLVYKNETYNGSTELKRTYIRNSETENSEQIVANYLMYEEMDAMYEIRNLYEFLHYVPLVPPSLFLDFVWRCFGNLSGNNYDYVMSQLNYLYKMIPESKAKIFADWYRDNEIRLKGRGSLHYPIAEYDEYYALISCYTKNDWSWKKDEGVDGGELGGVESV